MATLAEVEAAIAKAEAAGRTDLADQLRAHAAKMQPTPPDPARVQAAIAKAEAAGRQDLADALRAAVPAPAPAPAPADPNMPAAPPMGGSRTAEEIIANPQRTTMQQPQQFGQAAATMMEGPTAAMQAFSGGLVGGPSPSRDFLAQDPLTRGLPGPALTGLGFLGDVGGAGLSALGAGLSGAVGLATEAVPTNDRLGLGEELLGMSQFAVPELAGASSIPARVAASAPRVAAPAVKAAEVIAEAPAITDQAIGTVLGEAAKASKAPAGKSAAGIAAKAAPDQATIAAAERLGFDLPADVYATNPLIRRAAGGARGIVGSEAEGHWISTITKAINTADDLFGKITSGDVSIISDRVANQLGALQTTLKSEAGRLYDTVEKAVPKNTPVLPVRAIDMLEKRAADLGGVEKLAPAEQALLKQMSDGPTYEWTKTQKGRLGASAFGAPDQFPNFDKAFQRRLTGALSEDLVDAAGEAGGQVARDALRLANQLTAKQKGVQERIVNAFGKDGIGSIAAKINTAIRAGAKGDIGGLNKIMRILPEETRSDAILAAISNASKGSGIARNGLGVADNGGFGFSEFSKFWGGVRSNRKVENIIQEAIGDKPKALLDDLYRVSRALTDARGNVATTGKANQWLEMVPRGVVERIAQSSAAQQAVKKGAIGVGAMMGPVGAMGAAGLAEAINFGSKTALEASSKLFRSPEFLELMKKVDATPEVIAANPAVKKWAATQGIKDVSAWLKSIGNEPTAIAPIAGQEAANANRNPEYEALRGRY